MVYKRNLNRPSHAARLAERTRLEGQQAAITGEQAANARLQTAPTACSPSTITTSMDDGSEGWI